MVRSLRLMTVNLLHQHCDAADFARVLARHDPDVVVTQELGPLSADILAAAYPNHRIRPALDFTGRGIATRLEAEFGDIDMPGRAGTSAVLDVDGIAVNLAGIHLLNPVTFPWWTTARARSQQVRGLIEWLGRQDGPLIVAGDFNASPRWPAYRMMSEKLSDLVADWADRQGVRTERTWGYRPGWPRLLRIDHVFGSGLRASDVRVDTVRGTDHNPLIVDLTVL